MRSVLGVLKGLVLPLVLLLLLELATRTVLVRSDTIVSPIVAISTLFKMFRDDELWRMTGFTLATSGLGLTLAAVLAVPSGIALGLSARAARASFLTIEVLRPLPSIALAPLALIVFGFGLRMEVSIIAFACFWPILVLSQAAVRQVEPRLLEVGLALRFNSWDRAMKIILPSIVPRLFVALRLSVAIALVVAVTIEVAMNPNGMGYGLVSAQQTLDPASMMAWLIWIAVVGYLLNAAASALQRRIDRTVRVAP